MMYVHLQVQSWGCMVSSFFVFIGAKSKAKQHSAMSAQWPVWCTWNRAQKPCFTIDIGYNFTLVQLPVLCTPHPHPPPHTHTHAHTLSRSHTRTRTRTHTVCMSCSLFTIIQILRIVCSLSYLSVPAVCDDCPGPKRKLFLKGSPKVFYLTHQPVLRESYVGIQIPTHGTLLT